MKKSSFFHGTKRFVGREGFFMYEIIVNQTSRTGRGEKIWKEVEKTLKKENVSCCIHITQYEGHAAELARKISEKEGEINLIVLGGDGTMNEVINGITDFSKIHLGIIPTGSGNDLARGLGLSKEPIEALWAILDCKEEYVMDLGRVSWNGCERPRYFAISAGVGLDAEVCKKALHSKIKKFLNQLHMGKLIYLLLTIASLFSMKTTGVAARFDQKGQRNFIRAIFLAGMNQPCEGGGIPMAPRAKSNDGKLSVCCAWRIPKLLTFFCLPFLVLGKHESIPGFEVVDCNKYKVKMKETMVLHADGEYCGDVNEVTFECVPGILHIRK